MSKKRKKHQEPPQKLILRYLKSHPGKVIGFSKIATEFSKRYSKETIQKVLNELHQRGHIIQSSRGKYAFGMRKAKTSGQFVEGILDMTPSGNAFVISDAFTQDIFISASKVNRAFDGDRVKVALYLSKGKKRPEGEIVEVIERSREDFVGTVQLYKQHAFVVPDYQNTNCDFFIANAVKQGLKSGDRVIVKIKTWADDEKNPSGEIVEKLGVVGDNDTEMKAILVQNGFPIHFPEEVLAEAALAAENMPDEALQKRKDFRDVLTFTIDPEDAKDFDDAISFRVIDKNRYEIGVHIADVSYFVKPGTALDREAYKRGTSVYLVDRVLPMLPESLSNQTCSLRPDEEKFCFSAVFQMNDEGKVLHEWFGRTVIKSNQRFTYEQAQERIETGKGTLAEELKILNQIAAKLRDEKYKHGAISFETAEVQFIVDLDGVPLGIKIKERKDAHLLIEDFMLLANRSVAAFIAKKSTGKRQSLAFVYRVHDEPDPERLDDFVSFARSFGYQIQIDNPKQIPKALNKLMEEVKGKPEQNALEQLAIRSMAKAVYTTHNIGHFGLGFSYYTHFTSPIRRYPDVMVHRLLQQYLEADYSNNEAAIEKQCVHCSVRERKAMSAERESIKLKQVEFIQNYIGETFEGIITGIVHFGIFVEIIENKCEGLVPMSSLDWDDFVYEMKGNRIMGTDTGQMYRLGDLVKVQVVHADPEKRRIDFVLIPD